MDAKIFELRHHAAFERLVRFDVRITCRTGLHIGAGKSPDLAGSDLPVLRDASGRPLIPGSSLRGVLRAGLESLCRSLSLDAARPAAAPAAAGVPEELAALTQLWDRLCLIERLFGRVPKDRKDLSAYGSRLQISDALCAETVAVELRDGVAIDRETRTAAGSAKFDLEVVPAGTAFQGSIRLKNPADYEVGLLAQALWMLDAGILLLGGKTARGLGWVEVQATTPVDLSATDILQRTTASEPVAEADPFGPIDQKLARYLDSLRELADEAARAVATA